MVDAPVNIPKTRAPNWVKTQQAVSSKSRCYVYQNFCWGSLLFCKVLASESVLGLGSFCNMTSPKKKFSVHNQCFLEKTIELRNHSKLALECTQNRPFRKTNFILPKCNFNKIESWKICL